MLLKGFMPSPVLQEYVLSIGIVHFEFSKDVTIPVKAFSPRPGDSIEFFLRDPEFVVYPGSEKTKRPAVIINGQQTKLIHRHVGNQFLFLGIGFRPGALFRLTGIPADVLANTYIDAEAVLSKDIRLVTDQLTNAHSYTELISIAEQFVVSLIKRSNKTAHGIDKAAGLLLQESGRTSIDWLAKESCLSTRQFGRKFKERMGISPSELSRISRFDKAFKIKNTYPEKDWLSIAIQCGYYDYQHLVRDYKEFTGMSPTAFFQLDNHAPERAFGLSEKYSI